MVNFADVAAFERAIGVMQRELERDLQAATKEMAEETRKIAVSEARRDLGADTQFSGWRPGPLLSDLRVVRGRSRPSTLLTPTRTSAGGWTVAQFGRNSSGAAGGFQGPGVNARTGSTKLRFKKSGQVSIRRRKGRRWNGVTTGKNTAGRTLDRAEDRTDQIAQKRFRIALRKHFDVG